jgi:CRISPR-associated protein Csc2
MLNPDFFLTAVPDRPMGRYAHIILLRVTEGYALFQTDGELNRARVASGTVDPAPMTRITIFKRKQTTPERLTGRELLRRYGLVAESCVYNESPCGQCPDCITYGFAIGDSGSEKSRVLADTAFSLTDYAQSHEVFTLNAPYEDGTMTKAGDTTSRINSQDHVTPQTVFPAVITARDLTEALFTYVLLNVLTTRRYGATTTRGGTMRNHVVGIALSDGEIFSNLYFTQRLWDVLAARDAIPERDPVDINETLAAARELVPALLAEDGVRDTQVLQGDALAAYLDALRDMDEAALEARLQQAADDAAAYHHAEHIQKKK